MKKLNCIMVLMFLIVVAGLQAGVLVPALDDSTVLKNYIAAYQGGEQEINPDITNGQITLAARFNPDAAQSTGGPYIILEIGGTSNGTGLYLADGHVVFTSSTGSGPAVPPESMADTNWAVINNERTIAVELGPVNFGSENVVYASMDLVAGQLICSVNGQLNSYTITSTANTNLDGNESICFLTKGSAVNGWMGGLHELDGSALPLLYAGNSAGMTQTAGYNNQRGQIFNAMVDPALMAHNPDPYNGETNVDPAVITQLKFDTAEDPANAGSQNPDVTGHFVTVYDSDVAGEPNSLLPPLLETFVGAGTDPIAVDYTFGLNDVVYWQVEEQVSGAAKGDPNNIVGPIWYFQALPSAPVITGNPVNDAVFSTEQGSFTCIFSSKAAPTVIEWYKSSDPATALSGDDITVATDQDGDTYTSTLTIDNVEVADEDSYYCYVENDNGNDTSDLADLGVKRLMAHWTLDQADYQGGQYLDVSTEDPIAHNADPNRPPVFSADTPNGMVGESLDMTVEGEPLAAADSGDWAPSLHTGEVSISAWLNWAGADGGWQGVVSNRSVVGATTANFYIEIRQDNGNLQIGGIPGAGDVQVAPLPIGEWTHLSITARAGQVVIYINGEPLAVSTSAQAVLQNIVPVRIGALNRSAEGELLSTFNGLMDNVGIYNYAMSASDVIDLYYDVTHESVCLNPNTTYDIANAQTGLTAEDEGFTGDCLVNIHDFAAFASQWLYCGLYPDCP